ncbi:MAG: heparan-alpha-glucosaminide N-acetyltransferase domain-containing protein [Promethearchaeota archaeon]
MNEAIQDRINNEIINLENKYSRIRSIDFIKGFAISLIILAHSAGVWKLPELDGIYTFIFTYLDVFGSSLFIFLSALSVVFSIHKKNKKIPEKTLKNRVFIRGFMIMAIGTLYNLPNAFIGTTEFPFNLWGWNILMFIGFAQIFTYYIIKLTRGLRALIGISIILLTYFLSPFLHTYKENPVVYVIHFIVISPTPLNPLLPFVSICFISSIFGEILVEAMSLESFEARLDLFRRFLRNGVIFLFVGVLLGILDRDPFFISHGIYFPKFVIRGEPSNIFYSIGIALILIGSLFYYIDVLKKNNVFVQMFVFLGNVSLSLFLISYIWLPLFTVHFNIFIIWFAWIAYTSILAFMMYIWRYYFSGKYSLEWMMSHMVGSRKKVNNIIFKKLD